MVGERTAAVSILVSRQYVGFEQNRVQLWTGSTLETLDQQQGAGQVSTLCRESMHPAWGRRGELRDSLGCAT